MAGGTRTLADGRYVLEEHLGSGGMASVWLATDTRLHRKVAVKLMAESLAGDDQWERRFRREARAAASLSHPHIVKVFDFGIEDGCPYIVMAHVPEGSLKSRLQHGDPPPAGRLARELLDALAHVHAAGILHRDVKPGNVLLDAEGGSHLTDFGIARPLDATTMTQTGVVLGTMRYLAPEVAAGEPATEASDLYSAGRVIGEVAGDDADPALRALIDDLTAADPARRPRSAREALARLEEDGDRTAETRVMEPSVVRAREVAATARRSPWFFPAAALAAILVIAVLVVAIAAGGGEPSADRAAQPAPAEAPLSEQLDALDRLIEGAQR